MCISKKVIVVAGLLSLITLLQPVIAQSSSYRDSSDAAPAIRQKILTVADQLDKLQPRAGDLIGVALRQIDNVKATISPELSQQYLESIYRLSLALQQAHGSLQRIELMSGSVAGEEEAIIKRTKLVNNRLTDLELMLLDAGPNLLNLLDNPAERINIYKMVASLNQ